MCLHAISWVDTLQCLFGLTVPTAPVTNLVPRNINATTVELIWDPVNERHQNGIILSYNIYYRLFNSSDPYMMVFGVMERVSVSYTIKIKLQYLCVENKYLYHCCQIS